LGININAATIKNLEEKFGREKLEQFLNEFNTAGRIEALTEKEGRFILRQLSLNSLRNRILADAQEAGISPSAWQVQASFSRLASEADASIPLFTIAEGERELGRYNRDRVTITVDRGYYVNFLTAKKSVLAPGNWYPT